MTAPTALRKATNPVDAATASEIPVPMEIQDGLEEELEAPGGVILNDLESRPRDIAGPQMAVDTQMMENTEALPPMFPRASDVPQTLRVETRKVPIPPHRFTPLKNNWTKIYPPLVNFLKLQVRMNVKNRAVELRTSKFTTDPGALQKGEDFVKAFSLGFDIDDAIALLRLDDLYIETFEIKDVKTLNGDHLSRAIGRIAGKDGKTKFAIENSTKTRIVLADQKIHILGRFENIHVARESVVSLILGKPAGKIYNSLRIVSARMKERF